MSKSMQKKAALVALLVGAALASSRVPWNTIGPRTDFLLLPLGVLAFGIVNVFLSLPGTFPLRAISVAAAFAALLWPAKLLMVVVLLAWLAWPPAFMVGWALATRSGDSPGGGRQEGNVAGPHARIALAALIGAVAVASLAYRLLFAHGLQQTSALFVGLPALLAIVVVFAVSPRSATGVACKAVTVGLLVSLLFLGEGILCVAMSAPLFYAAAVAIAASMDWAHRRREKSATTLCSCFIVLALTPMSLEGVTDFTTLNRDESVSESMIVRGSSQAVERALFEEPRFDRVRPLYLRAGFPSPVATRIERGSGRMRWVIQFRGGEMRLNGMEPRTGDLILELEEARPGLVRWRAVSDTSHMTHFLTWRDVTVRWESVDASTTKVTWTLRYRRGLDPAWYFGPMERYAVRLAAGYLIDSVATP
jgi:hypothetical protein